MNQKLSSIEEIAFESMQGMLIATFWYLVVFGIAYGLELILPTFKWTLLIVSAYAVKYLLLMMDIWLFVLSMYSELRIMTKRINDYRRSNI